MQRTPPWLFYFRIVREKRDLTLRFIRTFPFLISKFRPGKLVSVLINTAMQYSNEDEK